MKIIKNSGRTFISELKLSTYFRGAVGLVAFLTVQPLFAMEVQRAAAIHPASQLCNQLGGTVVRYTTTTSTTPDYLCKLGDAQVSPMSLWYALRTGQELALDKFREHPNLVIGPHGNPASIYCKEMGGNPILAQLEGGQEFGICEFNENGHLSHIEQWTLLRGPQDPQNSRLVEVLAAGLPH